MNDFSRALLADGPAASIPAKDDLFGWMVGAWDFEWQDNLPGVGPRKLTGEWISSWVLQGRAIQDVFICPSREQEKRSRPDSICGTSVRIYNQAQRCWYIYYMGDGPCNTLQARRMDGDIVMRCVNCANMRMKWVFSSIKADSFSWERMISADKGKTWQTAGHLQAVRKA